MENERYLNANGAGQHNYIVRHLSNHFLNGDTYIMQNKLFSYSRHNFRTWPPPNFKMT
jgi:hypothetical protein